MTVSYVKLFKLLLDRNIKKGDLRRAAGISTATLAKLSKGQNMTTDVLVKICNALRCDFSDIMEMKFDIPVAGEKIEPTEDVESIPTEKTSELKQTDGDEYAQKIHKKALSLRLRRYFIGHKVVVMVVKKYIKK